MNKLIHLLLILLLLAATNNNAVADEKLKVVATLSTFANIAEQIGRERVAVSTIAAPRFNPHFIEPRPTDILRVKKADLFLHSGLDLEAWRGPLVNAAGNTAVRPGGNRELALAAGIKLLNVPQGPLSRAQGDIHLFGNPHYWLSPVNGLIIADSIAKKLTAIDPKGAELYKKNFAEFQSRLITKMETWRQLMAAYKDAELIGYHDEWVYLMDFANLQMNEFLEPKPGIPPTPKHLEYLTEIIKQRGIKLIVQATFYPKEAAESLASRTGAKQLLLCQNVNETEDCSDYIKTIDYNLQSIAEALQK